MSFAGPSSDNLRRLSPREWTSALAFCDASQLTLPLGLRCRSDLPHPVVERIEGNLAANAQRWAQVKRTYSEAAAVLEAQGLEFVVLKGFTMCPRFITAPEWRAQYDIDLLFRQSEAAKARDAVTTLGYEPLQGFDRFPIDHLPTMIRKTGWEWRGDYFDVDIPLALELHFRLWDERTEGFAVDTSEFWERRVQRELAGLVFTALQSADGLAYACLHLLRHLLRGDLRPSHVYELACFLHSSVDDSGFWEEWRQLHSGALRRVQAVGFAVARHWFDCDLSPVAAEEVATLPEPVAAWISEYGGAPLSGFFHPNKDELWLHLSLVEPASARFGVLRRRLFPSRLPGPVDAVHIPEHELTPCRRLLRRWRYLAYLAGRFWHHARTLPPTVPGGLRWAARSAGLRGDFWWFFTAASLFNVGLFVFFLLYNLYLLQAGFDERFAGLLSSALTTGSIAGALLAVPALTRWGMRRTLMVCLVVLAFASGARALFTLRPLLVGLAVVCGSATATWAVALSPTVASFTNERSRPAAFSLVFASGIGLGVVAGVLGGRLPGWLTPVTGSLITAYQAALLLGCSLVLLGTWPLSRLTAIDPPVEKKGTGRPDRRLIWFLAAIAVWHLGTGAFNPFFNTLFARLAVPVSQIGLLFSVSQLSQVGAVLLAPLVLSRLGLVRGVASMQLTTGGVLGALALMADPGGAATFYVLYMSAQYMSEPGMYSYLMDSTPASGRNIASSLNFVVAYSAQAVAAALAGFVIVKDGYPAVMTAAAILCGIAALLFGLLGPPSRSSS